MVKATKSDRIRKRSRNGPPTVAHGSVRQNSNSQNLFLDVENVVKLHSKKKWRKEGEELLGKIQTLRVILNNISTTKLVNKCAEAIEVVKKSWEEVLRENSQERSSGEKIGWTRRAATFIKNVEAAIWNKFDEEAKRRGLCCGREQETFTEKRCSYEGKTGNCLIRGNRFYYESEDPLLVYCLKHYKQFVDPSNAQGWTKVNIRDEKEPKLEECSKCGILYHPTCTHFRPQWSEPHPNMCPKCSSWETYIDVNVLTKTNLSKFMTRYVKRTPGKISIIIREFYVGRKTTGDWSEEEKENNRDLYEDIKGIRYRYRIIGAFQKIDGKLILVALFTVQEYGVSRPENPKNGQVTLEYFDTNHQYQQKRAANDQERTNVYSYILLAYFQYAASLGYSEVHIWACPPFEGQNYLFLGRSETQLPTTLEQLRGWYVNMSKKSRLLEEVDIHEKDGLEFILGDRNDIRAIRQRLYYEGGRFKDELAQRLVGTDVQEFKRNVGRIVQHLSCELLFFKIKHPAKPSLRKERMIPRMLFNSRETFALWQKREQYDWTTPQKAIYFTRKLIWDIFTDDMLMAKKEMEEKGDKAHPSTRFRVTQYYVIQGCSS